MKAKLLRFVSVVLFCSLVLAVILTVHIACTPPVGERFTEFYLLGPSGKAYGYPTNLTVGEIGNVIVGVVNHEYEDLSYRVVVKLENETVETMGNIELKHDVLWEWNCTFTPERIGERMKLEFLLFRDDAKETYRSLHLWITVQE